MLTDTKQSTLEIDAFLNKSILGRIVILNNKAYLYTTGGKMLLNRDHQIKVLNRREYIDVPYEDVLNKLCADGFYLYAGRTALVK